MAWQDAIGTTVAGIGDGIMYVLLVFILCGIGFMVWWYSQFKNRINCIENINGVRIIKQYRAMSTNSDDGTPRWKVMQKNAFPPLGLIKVDPQFMMIDRKGKLIYNCVKNKNAEPIGIRLDYDEDSALAVFTSFPSNERAEYMAQLEKVKKKEGTQLAQIILPVAALSVMMCVIIVGIIFWGDFNKPALEMADKVKAIEAERTMQLEILQEMRDNIQVIRDTAAPARNRTLPPG